MRRVVLEARETKLQQVVVEEDGVLVAMQVNVAAARHVNEAVARQKTGLATLA